MSWPETIAAGLGGWVLLAFALSVAVGRMFAGGERAGTAPPLSDVRLPE